MPSMTSLSSFLSVSAKGGVLGAGEADGGGVFGADLFDGDMTSLFSFLSVSAKGVLGAGEVDRVADKGVFGEADSDLDLLNMAGVFNGAEADLADLALFNISF